MTVNISHGDIERAKWRLWHGRWKGSLVKLAAIERWTRARRVRDVAGVRALQHHLEDLVAYLAANQSALVNYGARRRRGEPISTAFVESAINEIIARRMIKKQQMRWNRWTVQPFLDVRVAVLDGTLEGSFQRSIPTSARPMAPAKALPQPDVPTILHTLLGPRPHLRPLPSTASSHGRD